MKKTAECILICFCLTCIYLLGITHSCAQNKPDNLPFYDDKAFHFGWYIGGNSLYTNIKDNKKLPYNDSIMSVNAKTGLGWQVGLLADARLLSFLHVRFLPDITFTQREFEFYVLHEDGLRTARNNFEVIYLDLPIEVKLMAKRWHNFRPYLIGGFKYDYDLGSIRRKKIADDEFLFKINESEMLYTVGVGFDFYFSWFKMAVELKSSFGITDILNRDYQTVYADCIEKMKSQLFYINLTFQ